jgi:hypothetical protein
METKLWLSTGPQNIKPTDTIRSTKRLHAFCTSNSIRDALVKSQGGWYWLQKDGTLRFIDRCLDNITFEEVFNLKNT